MNPLTYQRFDDDVFMLLCRADWPPKEIASHPVIAELDEQLDETRQCDAIRTGHPYGPLYKPRAWCGYFTIGSCEFQIKSMYSFPKFFGLICDTEEGTHDPAEIQAFVDGVNEGARSRPTGGE